MRYSNSVRYVNRIERNYPPVHDARTDRSQLVALDTDERPHGERTMTSAQKSVRYLAGGLLIGGFWYLNRHRPPVEEVLRTVVVFTVLMTLLRAKLRRQGIDVHLVPLIATKIALVVVAALVQHVLRSHAVADATLIVAIGLGVAVCLAGLVGDRYFFGSVAAARMPSVARGADHR